MKFATAFALTGAAAAQEEPSMLMSQLAQLTIENGQEEQKSFVHMLANMAIEQHEAEQEEPKSFVHMLANLAIEQHEAESEPLNALAQMADESAEVEPELDFMSTLAQITLENGIEENQEEPKSFVSMLANLAIEQHEAEQQDFMSTLANLALENGVEQNEEESKSFVHMLANLAIEQHEAESQQVEPLDVLASLAVQSDEVEQPLDVLASLAEQSDEVEEPESFVGMLAHLAMQEHESEQQAMPFLTTLAQITVDTAEAEQKQMEAVAELQSHSVTDMLAIMTLQNGQEEVVAKLEEAPVEEEQPEEIMSMFSTLLKADDHMKQLEEQKNMYEYDQEELLNTIAVMDMLEEEEF